ncbi:MAG: replicative DNA helicase [Spirochaetaceae bacterium]|jgi:replicative DNA helicase|nr:replicative DNA helicase [Spirochaetaceae bacterium]
MKNSIPPNDLVAEQAMLGALLMDNAVVANVMQYVGAEDFYSRANGKIFDVILELCNKNVQADIITVTQELRHRGGLDEAGGPGYVASLTNVVPSSANIEYFAQTVRSFSLRRALIRICKEVIGKAFDESLESQSILEETQQKIFELSGSRQAFTYRAAKEIVDETIDIIEQFYRSKKSVTGVPSGFPDLDALTAGFQNAELIVIGARPSMGKTALALTMASHIAIKLKIPTGFFTLEMSDKALMLRLISSETGINANAIRTGFLKDSDFHLLMTAADSICDAPLYIVDRPNMKLLDLRAQARLLRSKEKVEIIFIDYLTLIASDNYRLPRYEQIAEISRSLKSLARELAIPIVALSQLTREAEKEKPNLASIRESGAIEQDADVVMFLHGKREADMDPAERAASPDGEEGIQRDLILAKQRNGPVGTVNLRLLSKYTKFVSLEKYQDL